MTAVAQALSAALLDFIWQGTLVALLLWMALTMLRNRTANERYAASCAALALMAALPAVTAWMVYRHSAAITTSPAIATGTSLEVYAARVARQSPLLAWMAMWRQWALPAWSVGVWVFALRVVLGCRHVAALRRFGHAAEGQIAETVSLLARRMKAGRPVRVLISSMAESPSVVGWLRPAILLPAATLAGLEPEQLRAVLAHEIAHIRRHDYLVNLMQTMVETLLFYHPAVWWASARIRHERELCCDDAAVQECGDAICYARALTRLERLRAATPRLALGSTGGALLYRIQRLAGVRPEMGPSKLPGIAALAVGLACFAATVHWAKAQTGQMVQQPQAREEWGVTVSATGELLRRDRVEYPESAYQNGIEGAVMVEATLDREGSVADARVLNGPPELRKAALESVLQWRFANGRAGETQQVNIVFQQDARAQAQHDQAQHDLQKTLNQVRMTDEFLKDQLRAAEERGDSRETEDLKNKIKQADVETQLRQLKAMAAELQLRNRTLEEERPRVEDLGPEQANMVRESQLLQLNQQLEDARKRGLTERHPQMVALMAQMEALRKQVEYASLVGARLGQIEIRGVPDSARAELGGRLSIGVGDILTEVSMRSAIAAIHEFDPRLECRFTSAGNGDAVLRITGPE
jgi:TonB family protein